jgi:hypothetical protein
MIVNIMIEAVMHRRCVIAPAEPAIPPRWEHVEYDLGARQFRSASALGVPAIPSSTRSAGFSHWERRNHCRGDQVNS